MKIGESILIDYIKGGLSDDKMMIVERELERNDDLRETYFHLKDVWDYTGMKVDFLKYNKEKEWLRVEEKITRSTFRTLKSTWVKVAGIAAALIISFLIGHTWNSLNESQELQSHVFKAPMGQISELVLADGSVIVLNAGSSLSVPSNFGENDRSVELSGEALFKVAKNKEKEFVVKSGSQAVKVLGTIFNVRAYPGEGKIFTTLEEGVVRWELNNQHIILKPGIQVVYDVKHHTVEQRNVDAVRLNSWAKGKYIYENALFEEIVDVLQKWYDVEVQWNESDFNAEHFNGVIKRSASLHETLDIIDVMVPIDFEVKGQLITIKRLK